MLPVLRLMVLIASLAAVVVSGARAQGALMELAAGDLRFSLRKNNGLALSARGVDVIRESHIYLVTPGWTAALLDSTKITPQVVKTTGGARQAGTALYTTGQGSATFSFEVRDDNTFVMSVEYDTKGAPGEVEAAVYLNSTLLSGVPYEAETVDGPRRGVAPTFAESPDQAASRLTPRLSRIRFDTAIGPMEVTMRGSSARNAAMTLFDARAIPLEWAVRNPIFWFGLGSPAVQAGPGKESVEVTFAFGAAPKRERTGDLMAAVPLASTPRALVPAGPDLPVIPRPKEMTVGSAPLSLDGGARVVIADAASEEEKAAARAISDELRVFWHVRAPIVRASAAGEPRRGDITIAVAPTPEREQGYRLRVDADTARIVGDDPRGAFHGAQTLKQLIRVDADGVRLLPVEIRDWPTLSWRGVHWFGGPDALPWHHRMISHIIAPLKYNAMVYEASFTEWASQPEIRWEGRATKQEDVRRTVAIARNHLLEPIPMVQSLGHLDWLFHNGRNMDIVADPETPYAYDPDNPRTYEVIFGLFQEAIDLFQPKTFHIGHDEVELRGVFPPPGRAKTTTDYVIEDTNRLYDWLKAKGLDVMMWGDMLLHPSEGSGGAAFAPTKDDAAKRRAGIPKDILIADWHYNYSAEPEYPSVEVLQKDGFRVLGSTWFGWGNIQGFAKVLNAQKSLGMLQTTWAGFSMSMDLMETQELGQFIAYVVAAEAAWNGGANDPRKMDYSPEDAFLALWNRKPIATEPRAGFTVGLSAAGNAAMWAWMPGVDDTDRAGFPEGDVTLVGTAFHLGRAILLDGPMNPEGAWPNAVEIPLGGRLARELHFLWGATHPTVMLSPVATLTLEYEDGASVDVPLAYGREIFAFTDLRARKHTTVAWRGRTPDDQRADARRWIWTNPHPEKPIARVRLVGRGAEAAPVLLALTGVE